MSPYDRSGERKGSGGELYLCTYSLSQKLIPLISPGSILATPHQVANDPESYGENIVILFH
jgi:hypothetical protein